MNFAPVETMADLDSLDHDQIVEGFMDGYGDPDAPEPGPNRGRAYWHGWRCAMMDRGAIEIDAAHRRLAREVAPGGRVRLQAVE